MVNVPVPATCGGSARQLNRDVGLLSASEVGGIEYNGGLRQRWIEAEASQRKGALIHAQGSPGGLRQVLRPKCDPRTSQIDSERAKAAE